MAWSVDTIYGYLKYQLRKNAAGGISSTDFFYAWNSEQTAYESDLLGRWQRAANSKEGANTGLIENETIMTILTPLIKSIPVTITADQAIKPLDHTYTLSLRINNHEVFQVNPSSLWALNEDVIDPPSVANNAYYYTEYQNYFQFLPTGLSTVQLDYVQVAPDIFWNYSLALDGMQDYNPIGSIQPVWDDLSIIEITRRCMKTLGVSFKDEDFAQFGQSVIQTGD